MPKCVICKDYYHPDMMIEKNIRGDEVVVCHFCSMDKKELTIEDEDGKVTEIVTKPQAVENYKVYIKRLMDKPSIAKAIQEDKQ